MGYKTQCKVMCVIYLIIKVNGGIIKLQNPIIRSYALNYNSGLISFLFTRDNQGTMFLQAFKKCNFT